MLRIEYAGIPLTDTDGKVTLDYDEYEYRGRNDRGHLRMLKLRR